MDALCLHIENALFENERRDNMTRDKYLTELGRYLGRLPNKELQKTMDYYYEYTGNLEKNGIDLVAQLGTPEELANTILSDTAINRMSKPDKGIKGRIDGFWMAILAIFALPVALPVAIAFTCVGSALMLVGLVIMMALLIAAFAVGAGGILCITASISVWVTSPMTGIGFTGVGLVLLGAGLLVVLLMVKMWGVVFKLIGNLFESIVDRFIRK